MQSNLINITISLGLIGSCWYVLGLLGWFYPLYAISIAAIIILTLIKKPKFAFYLHQNKILLTILVAQIAINALGLFVPETSFDAVWYHLPEAQVYAATGKISKIPELMYSTMPRLGEILFSAGFWLPNAQGHKLITFAVYLLFLSVLYNLAKTQLDQTQALIFTIVVNSFNLIAWQSTAGYVDILRSLFELTSLYCLIIAHRKWSQSDSPPMHLYFQAGILTGFALSVKMQSLIGLAAGLAFIFMSNKKNKFTSGLLYLASALIVCLPWYYDNYLQTGHPLYPINNPALQQNLVSHAATTNLIAWVMSQTIKIPLIPFRLSIAPESQLSPLILILMPFLYLSRKYLISHHKPLILFSITYVFLFWFLPPPETRYALTGIIAVIFLEFIAFFNSKISPNLHKIVINFILISVFINLSIRLAVTYQNLPVILGSQTREEYINSHTTDFNRDKMNKFHSGYWLNLVNSKPVQ